MLYKSSWSLLDGVSLDLPIVDIRNELPPNEIQLLQLDGFFVSGHTVYYSDSGRVNALIKLKKVIEIYMKKCISEHESIIQKARYHWVSLTLPRP